MSTLLWIFISFINVFGVKADICDDRTISVGVRCQTTKHSQDSMVGSSYAPDSESFDDIQNGF